MCPIFLEVACCDVEQSCPSDFWMKYLDANHLLVTGLLALGHYRQTLLECHRIFVFYLFHELQSKLIKYLYTQLKRTRHTNAPLAVDPVIESSDLHDDMWECQGSVASQRPLISHCGYNVVGYSVSRGEMTYCLRLHGPHHHSTDISGAL